MATTVPIAPPPKPQTAALSKNELTNKVLSAFQGKIQPTTVPRIYHYALALVAVSMILLPLVYLGIVGGVAYGVYYLAMHTGATSYIPIIAGSILVLFMLKPLVIRPARMPAPRKLNPIAEPFLFEFVKKICQAVGAPVPAEIHVNCEVNASASFRHGLLSMFSNELVLTIGMPLAGGLTMREFAGVLAHEFGHFTQYWSMRVTYIIRHVNAWFARLVYQRDILDQWLWEGSQSEEHAVFKLICLLTRGLVWLSRGALYGLMLLGNVISSFMMRQMEFDADLHEARLAGGSAFESTVRKLPLLGMAHSMANESLQREWSEGRLADDLPALIAANVTRITPELQRKMQKQIAAAATGTFDTHPSDQDRLEAVRREKNNGVFWVELPAHELFRDFKQLSRTVSTDLYQVLLGPDIRMNAIRPVDELIASDKAEEIGHKTLRRFMQTQITPVRPLPIVETLARAPRDPGKHADDLIANRRRVCDLAPIYAGALKKYNDRQGDIERASGARLLVTLGVSIDARALKLPSAGITAINDFKQAAMQDQVAALQEMVQYEQAAADRLYGALCLLKVPEVAAKIPDLKKIDEDLADVLPPLVLLGGAIPTLMEVALAHNNLMALLSNFSGHENDQQFITCVLNQSQECVNKLGIVRGKLGDVLYPFARGDGIVTLAEWALKEIPPMEFPGAVAEVGEVVLDRLLQVYYRLMKRVIVIAEKAEVAVGLPALQDLPDDKTFEFSGDD